MQAEQGNNQNEQSDWFVITVIILFTDNVVLSVQTPVFHLSGPYSIKYLNAFRFQKPNGY